MSDRAAGLLKTASPHPPQSRTTFQRTSNKPESNPCKRVQKSVSTVLIGVIRPVEERVAWRASFEASRQYLRIGIYHARPHGGQYPSHSANSPSGLQCPRH